MHLWVLSFYSLPRKDMHNIYIFKVFAQSIIQAFTYCCSLYSENEFSVNVNDTVLLAGLKCDKVKISTFDNQVPVPKQYQYPKMNSKMLSLCWLE